MKPTLLVLAAGLGSRYGGIKQMEAVGPGGEIIIDYSIYDAIKHGYGKVVFVIREEIEEDFRKVVGDKWSESVQIEYVFQRLDDLPGDFIPPGERTKPWGTGHAMLAAREAIDGSFTLINADDFYGSEAFETMSEHHSLVKQGGQSQYAMVGYKLENTLSEHGSVNRGICEVDDSEDLTGVTEVETIGWKDGRLVGNFDGKQKELSSDAVVSLNFWGFLPDIFSHGEAYFAEFLGKYGESLTHEMYLPDIVFDMLSKDRASVKVYSCNSPWFGITNPDDLAFVKKEIASLVEKGVYPERLV